MPTVTTDPVLSPRYSEALQFCFEIHSRQFRKRRTVPYVSHLLAVSALVMELGGSEDEAIGALLHDSAEDCGGRPMLEQVRQRFGDAVAAMVEGCTDSLAENPEKKEDWWTRKERYLKHLREADRSTQLVAACDKLHNLRNTVRDLRAEGAAVWSDFNAGAADQVRYYSRCTEIIEAAGLPIASELRREVGELIALAGEAG